MVYWGYLGRAAIVILGLAYTAQAHAQTAAPEGYIETLNWYHQQAEAGNPRAQFLLAIKYETGTDVTKSLSRAADLFEQAARQGLPDAQFKFATTLETGRGRPADLAAAETWYRAAALQTHSSAQFNLGVTLLNQARSEDEIAEAISWLLRAGRAGLSPATRLVEQLSGAYAEDVLNNARSLADVPLSPAAGAR